jgi:TatD DNase family protein
VREAFDDFWPIFEQYEGIRGVLHRFTDSKENMEKAVEKGLYIGVNGISTFTKDEVQKAMFDAIPLDRILFETDAPFLTPNPYRGKINQPAYVRVVAEYHAQRRGISFDEIADISSQNARALFHLK